MRNFAKIIGTIAGGIGAIIAMGTLLSGCDDEDENDKTLVYYGPRPSTAAEKCCGDTLGLSSDLYSYCLTQYEKINECDRVKLTEQPSVYGPAPVTENEIKECCGEDKQAEGYNECISDIHNTRTCNKPVQKVKSDAEKCCADQLGLEDTRYEICMEQYQSINECDSEKLIPQTYYGPAFDENELKACCGEDSQASGYNECMDDFVAHPDTCNKPVPGSDKAIEQCCGKPSEDQDYKDCIAAYKVANQCDNTSNVYGMPPVDDIMPVDPKPEES